MKENFSDFDLVEILIKYYKLKEILYQIKNTLIKYYKFKERAANFNCGLDR